MEKWEAWFSSVLHDAGSRARKKELSKCELQFRGGSSPREGRKRESVARIETNPAGVRSCLWAVRFTPLL